MEVVVDGRPVDIGGRLPRSIFAVLALSANQVVSADRLADDVWGGEPPPTAIRTLQAYAARLRKALADEAASVETSKAGYLLTIDPDAIDAVRFEAMAHRGRTALAAGDLASARTICEDALRLWRGPALVDFSYADFAQAAILRLEELRLGAIEDRVEADLQLRPFGPALAELEGLVTMHPFRERLRGQLMRALHWAGRSAEALRVYQSGRTLLAEEFGVDPGPELQDLEGAILRNEEHLAPPSRPSESASGNMPRPITSFVGRQQEAADLLGVLTDHRVVTIVGTGGAGKTRLAVHVGSHCGDRFLGGAWFVDLAPLTEAELAGRVLAKVLGIQEEPDTPIEATIAAALATRSCLIVLDNCEHLTAAVRALVASIVPAAPMVRILATSRQPLGLAGELVWPIPALPMPEPGAHTSLSEAMAFDAFRLLVDRATTAAPDLRLGDLDVIPLQSICRRLDGLPLAIELAAGRLRTLSPAEIEARLSDRFRLFGQATSNGTGRHDNLEAVVQWSFDLLSQNEQVLFARLAVFAGSFTLDAVEQVCGRDGLDTDEIAGLLTGLADKSLVTRAEILEGRSRFRLLETLRTFSARHLTVAVEADAVRARHAAYFVEQADALGPAVRGPRWADTIELLNREIDDHRDAFEWLISHKDGDGAARVAGGLWPYWFRVSPTGEARSWIERARVLNVDAPVHRVRLLVAAAGAAFAADDLGAALAATEEGLVLARDGDGDAKGEAHPSVPYLLATRALTLRLLNRTDEAGAAADEAAAVADAADDDWAKADACRVRALLARDRGDLVTAERCGRRAVELWDGCGDVPDAAGARSIVGVIAADDGNLEEAERLYEASLRGFRAARDRVGEAHVLWRLAELALERADPVGALDHARSAAELAQQLGDRRMVGQAETAAAEALIAMGQLQQAETAVAVAVDNLSAVGFAADLCRVFHAAARIALSREAPDEAAEWVQRSLESVGTPRQQADTQWLRGLTLAAQGELGPAQVAALQAGELARASGYSTGLARSLECQAIIASADGQHHKADVLRRAVTRVLLGDTAALQPVTALPEPPDQEHRGPTSAAHAGG